MRIRRLQRERSHRARGVVFWTACALAAFYVLASGRALVPGLCLSLAALESCPNPVVSPEDAHACCAPGGSSTSPAITTESVEHARCPFCHLAQSPTSLVERLHIVQCVAPLEASGFAPSDAIYDDVRWEPLSRRGPPALLT